MDRGYIEVFQCLDCGNEHQVKYDTDWYALDGEPDSCPFCGGKRLEVVDSVTITEKGNERMRFI
jgi:hypothetical protein